MKQYIAAAGLALLALATTVKAQYNVLVDVSDQSPPYYGLWTDTHASVTNGEWISINSSGLWNIGGQAVYPDGFIDANDDLFLGDGLHGSLIAYVGSDPFQGNWPGEDHGYFFPQETNYWAAGTSVQFMSATNGELWLGFNDDATYGNYSDNSGSVTASLNFGFSTNVNSSYYMALVMGQVSSNSFSFGISNGIPSSVCSVYDSSDLDHWTLIDSLLLDSFGSSQSAYSLLNSCGGAPYPIVDGNFNNLTGVAYRFYKVTDGQFISRTIGFARLMIGPGTTNAPGTNALIANQFNSPVANTLDGLFNPMPDGTYLPGGAAIMKWNGSAYDIYTWNGSWGAGGSVTLNPGEAAFLVNPTTNAIPVTFAGLVDEGSLSQSFSAGQETQTSSQLPKAGGVQSTLGYIPNNDDQILIWTDSSYISYKYSSTAGHWVGHEPILQVGEGFFLNPKTNNIWLQNYSSRQF